MKSIFLPFLNKISAPFAGKGIDKKFPFLVKMHEKLYAGLQSEGLVTVPLKIPNTSNLKLQVEAKDTYVGMFLINTGIFEPEETKLLLSELNSGSVVFDIGANIGYYSIVSASKQGVSVYSFEPDKDSFDLLKSNISLNGLTSVTPVPLALGAQKGKIPFTVNTEHRGKSGISANGDFDYEVDVLPLDEYCRLNNIKEIDVIKLDVEGLEIDVLTGAKNTIQASPNLKLFVELNPESLRLVNKNVNDFLSVLADLDLVPSKIIDETRSKTLDFSKEVLDEVLSHSTFTNLLCIRK